MEEECRDEPGKVSGLNGIETKDDNGGSIYEQRNDEKEGESIEETSMDQRMVENVCEGDKQVEVVSNVGWPSGIALSKVLWRQIKSLQEAEKEVHEKLEKERLEQLVEKVENEVEYEGILEDMCSKIRAEEEATEIERREREWELERREVNLEEQVMALKEKVRRLEEELKMKNDLVQGRQEEMDDALQRLLCEAAREGDRGDVPKDIEALAVSGEDDKPSPSPSHALLIAFEDMLKEADERHEREKRALEETIRAKEEAEHSFRHERHKRRAREKHMESQMVAMHKEIGRLSSLLKERENSVLVEKERRQSLQDEAMRLATMLKDEKLAHRLVMVKLKKLESFFSRLKEKLAREQSDSGREDEFLKNLEKDIQRLSALFSLKKELPKTVESEQFEALRKQLDTAIAERDKSEEKRALLLKRSRDREAEIDAMWLEREKILIDKMAILEERSEELEMKCRRYEEDIALEKSRWEEDACTLKKAWDDEKHALEVIVRERDSWFKEQEGRMQSLLQAKEQELLMLKTVQQKLLNTLALYKKQADGDQVNEAGNSENSGIRHCLDFESMALELREELENHTKETRLKEENLEKERHELREGAERLSLERKTLESKVFDTLSVMEELKKEMQAKENKMQWELQQMEAKVASKTAEVETLKRQLEAKELELEGRVDKFRREMQLIEQEFEKERKERERMLDSHYASKKKMDTEVQLKEEFWEKDMNRMVQEATSLRSELRKKTSELERVNTMLCTMESEFTKEKENLVAAGKELEEELQRLRVEKAELLHELQASTSTPEPGASESLEAKRNAEWQFALGKVAVFDKQINEAMLAIQTLREELAAKEAELQKAKSEPELELERREEAWMEERQLQEAAYKQKFEALRKREQEISKEKSELLRILEVERSEASDSIALLNGIIRELHWSVTRKGAKDTVECVDDLLKNSKKGDMVKVHSSHLKDVDQYICELKAKVEELEKFRAPNVIAEKKPSREDELDEALLHVEKEMLKFSPDRRIRLTAADESPLSCTRSRSLERSLLATTSQPGTSADRAWNFGGHLSCVAKDTIEHRWLPPELPGLDPLSLALPIRQQKKWVVDTSWIEHVRKEHSLLTQQLALERQRVAALGQIEAENRWMEAMMLRALQQKKEYELKLSQLQQKVTPWGQERGS